MNARWAALIAALSLFLGGCAFERAKSPTLPPARPGTETAVLLDDGCAPRDPRIPALAARLHALSGRSGYYALREMGEAAKDRDELVLRLVAREMVVSRCMPEGPELTRRRLLGALLLGALLDGNDPVDFRNALVVFDRRLHPIWLPFGHRVCSGHGFEGAAECFAFGVPAVLADVVTFPLGTWIWAAKDDEKNVALWRFPPSAEVEAVTQNVEALRRLARASHLGPSDRAP